MLLVLAVLMAVVGITLPAYQAFETAKEEQRFFDLLLHDIYYAQSECYSSPKTVGVMFRNNPLSYDVVINMYEKVATRKLPESVALKKTSNLNEIVFWSNCSIQTSGTLRFDTSTGERTVTVHLGKGRVVISE